MKKYLFIATAFVALASCTSDDFVGESPTLTSQDSGAIAFGSGLHATTRALKQGADAAGLLNNNFVVEGVKGNGTTQETVFDHYNVNWVNNTANTTTSNTNDWEYVAQAKHDLATVAAQSIKYWDYATTQYDFIAYSKGTATAVYTGTPAANEVLFTKITPSTLGTSAYTVKGKADELAKVYIADMVTAYRDDSPSGYQSVVQFKFRSLSAKVRIGLYETVPGYSVKDVVFYTDGSTAATDGKAHLYTTGTDVFNETGTYTVYFPTTGSTNKSATDYNKAHLSFVAETSGTATVKDFGSLDNTNTAADKEVAEAGGKVYLGRFSNAATYAGENDQKHYTTVIPNETGADLNLKVNYTLLSTDGSGETIHVTGATAQVPAVYATWKSGYAYTYLFKISQNSNGVTNPSAGPAGLYPITFDAVVTESEDGVQETITTVSEPSITTYSKGAIVTGNNEYITGSNIYVVVEDNGSTASLNADNAKLYTVTLTDTDTSDGITTAAQTINEASVANALAQGGSVTDANKFTLAVSQVTIGTLTYPGKIDAADATDGNEVNINCAKFTPATAGTYVFEYTKSVTTYIQASDTYVAGTTYYTDNSGTTTVDTSSFEVGVTDVSSYFVSQTTASGEKTYKIIKVVSGS